MACPPLTIRSVKGSPLTSAELDGNFVTLKEYGEAQEELVNEVITRSRPASYYAASNSGTDSYKIDLSPVPDALTDLIGKQILIRPDVGNTAASSLTVNSLASTPIKRNASDNTVDGDIVAGKIFVVVFDGQNFQLL